MKQIQKYFVKTPYTAKPSCDGNIGHRHSCVVNELLREQHSPRLCDRGRRCAEVLQEQTTQLAFSHAQPCRQLLDVVVVPIESTLGNESKSARHGIGSASPGV